MSFSRKTIIYAAAPLSLAAVLATTAGATAASASVHQPPRVASGSVAVSGQGYPVQYEQFQALQGFGRNHGYVVYTNFGLRRAWLRGLRACGKGRTHWSFTRAARIPTR